MEKGNRRSVDPKKFKTRLNSGLFRFRVEDRKVDGLKHEKTVRVPDLSGSEYVITGEISGGYYSFSTATEEWASTTGIQSSGENAKITKVKPSKSLNHELVFKVTKKLEETVGKDGLSEMREELEAVQRALDSMTRKQLTTQADRLTRETSLRLKEIATVAAGYDRFVSLEKVAKYFPKVRDGKIGICPWGEYLRDIPDSVFDSREKADPVFDGFVIMHCTSEEEAKKKLGASSNEAERQVGKKDPILFGIHEGSDRMWLVDEWIDELCDLTFDELVCDLAKAECSETKATVKKASLKDRLKSILGQ